MDSSVELTGSEMVDKLQSIVDDMRDGRYTESSEVIVLTRDAECDIITITRFGSHTGLLADAWAAKRPEA